MPVWMVALVFYQQLMITVIRSVALHRDRPIPRRPGETCETVVQALTILAIIGLNIYHHHQPGQRLMGLLPVPHQPTHFSHWVGAWSTWVMAFATVVTAVVTADVVCGSHRTIREVFRLR